MWVKRLGMWPRKLQIHRFRAFLWVNVYKPPLVTYFTLLGCSAAWS